MALKPNQERVLAYAVKEFETAFRSMLETGHVLHSFSLSDHPPLDMLIVVGNRLIVQALMDELDRAAEKLKATGVN